MIHFEFSRLQLEQPSVWLPGKPWISCQETWLPEFPCRNHGFLNFLPRILDFWIPCWDLGTTSAGRTSRNPDCPCWQGSSGSYFITGRTSCLCLLSMGSRRRKLRAELSWISRFSSWVNVDICSFIGSKFALIFSSNKSGKPLLMDLSALSKLRAVAASAVFSAFTDGHFQTWILTVCFAVSKGSLIWKKTRTISEKIELTL